ncbi:8782_t:CDS:2 [Dentiscutata erythropus]|uniref:8782_t:CDS:1 n=1 Tax=Dentiscutata erythropus TaxID=1348616 RepID=A0A9N9GPC5_9GLOM|nr:8782_t:CDS:2 [Dentiscutata erythropus]
MYQQGLALYKILTPNNIFLSAFVNNSLQFSKCKPVVVEAEFKGHLDLSEHDFTKVDAHARGTPDSEACSVEQLSKHLTSCWEDHLDKLRSIYVWVTEHIEFDCEDSGDVKNHSADETLKKRKGGFSELFNELATHAELKTWKIKGKTRGIDEESAGSKESVDCKEADHTWNATIYKGEYLFIDCAWGAGRMNGKQFEKYFEPFYFLTPPIQFIYSHFPDESKEQYITPQLTKEEFLNLTHIKPAFFAAGLEFHDKSIGNVITTNDDVINLEVLRFQPDEGKPLYAVLNWEGQEHEVLVQRMVGYQAGSGFYHIIKKMLGFGSGTTTGLGKNYKLHTTCPSGGEGKLEIYVLFEGNKGPLAASFKVINKGDGKNHCSFFKTFKIPFKFTIHQPTHSKLQCEKDYKFEFTVFDLKEDEHPEFALLSPEKKLKKLNKKCKNEDGSVTYDLTTKIDQTGDWKLACSKNGKNYDLIAQYQAE